MGLIVTVYRPVDFPDCTMNGITARFGQLTATGVGIKGPFEPNVSVPEIRVIYREQFDDYIGVPVDENGNPKIHGMFGGNYISTSDSRFRRNGKGRHLGAIPVHDRFEW